MEAAPVQAITDQHAIERALQRSALYQFLATALRPPAEGFVAAVADNRWRTALQALRMRGEGNAAAVKAALGSVTGLSPEALAEEYHRAFGHQVGVDCPLYEAQYSAGEVFQQAQCLADIAAFYRAFGLDVGAEVRERPDHISVELEFMCILAYREAYARAHHGPAEVALLVDAQRAFLRDHLARWVPSFSRLVGRKAEGPYAELARLLAAWVIADAQALGVGPIDDFDLTPAIDVPAPGATEFACGVERCVPEPGS